jgi:hypothetical protein
MEDDKIIGAGVVFVIVVIAGIIFCMLGFDYVDASHLGVMNQMGTIKGVMSPGIRWTGLFTHVYTYDMRLRKVHVEMEGQQYAPDKTGQPVFAQIDVNYRLKRDAVQNLYQNVGPDNVVEEQLNIIPLITEGFKRATVKYEALEILDKREEVAHLAEQNIKDRFPVEYFEIDQVVISNIHYSDQFQKAIDDKKTAIQLTAVAQQNLEKVKFEQGQEIEKYKAEAEKLKLQKSEISDLLVKQQWVAKWDGKLPSYMLTTPDNANFILSLPAVQGATT